jgi:hypothetical protein
MTTQMLPAARGAILALMLVIVSGGCGRRRELVVSEACQDPKVVDCLREYAREDLYAEDVRALNGALMTCFSKDAVVREKQATCLPLQLGKDRGTGLEIVAVYTCSDLCPYRGYPVLVFDGRIKKEECCEIGGLPMIDPAWGGYKGCSPATGYEELREKRCK